MSVERETVTLGVLGDVEVWVNGERVDIGHSRQRGVLGVLLVDANQAVSADRLIDRVWGEQPPHAARSALRTYLSHLRRALAPTGVTVTRRGNGYVLASAADTVDLHRFRELLRSARGQSEPRRALALAEDALALWRGEPLAELDTPWAQSLRRTLHQERFVAQLDRADWALQDGRHTDLLGELTALAADHPLDERLTGLLMLASYRSGRQAAALRHYDRLRRQLAEELGTDPSPPVRELHERILRADTGLLPPPATAPMPSRYATSTTRRNASPTPQKGRAPACLAVLACAAGASMLIAADSPPDRVSTALHAAVSPETLPPAGGYRIKLAHSTLCLSEDPTDDSGRVYQRDCARAMPTMALRLVRDDVYRILTHHPRFGGGCMGVPKASAEAGAAVYDGFCDTGAAEDFQLVPSESTSTGFRLRAVHSNLCLGVLDVSMADWAPVFQLPCDSSGAGQTFTFEPRT
ncbi:BTAD domain-containing putative transcriptional regulator [Amycolatopsis sp. MJM2582]|uniref:BTAD domain-containing putative transcriptional regulator n=1 Tax=Amycolatopsis sp. MJM2582 TaxID=1427749 RepID=UPI0009DDB933|nr:BTAD domain-containing putative transcriptional regulator [Amycolatopsis sp. MJM2582]